VASIERTAYPRFRREPSAAELQQLFTPREEEVEFARSPTRTDQNLFGFVVLLKSIQHLSYFPELAAIPCSGSTHSAVATPASGAAVGL
jgi:hypothetical protein